MARHLLLMIVFFCGAEMAHAEDSWCRFRGPNGAGQSDAVGIPAQWGEDAYAWKVDLPGVGHSSPVFWGQELYLTAGDPESGDLIVLRLDAASGKTVWQKSFGSKSHHLHARNSYASSTPAVDQEHIYLALVTPEAYRVLALDHNGEKVWEQNLGLFNSQHGFGTSPIVYQDRVVIGNDQMGDSFLIALDCKTGEQRWKTYRQKTRRTAYGVPCVYQAEGDKPVLIFTSGANGMSAVDPDSGDVRWEIDLFDKRSVSSPVIAGGLIFGSCGSGGGGNYVCAVKPGDRFGTAPELAYKVSSQAPYVPSALAYGDLVFLWYDKGIVSCIDAPTGKVHWQKRVGGNFSGSPIRVGEKIYCISDEGEVVCLSASKEYELLGRTLLEESSRATPAMAGGKMYLRTYSKLYCLAPQSGN
ncbi:MAG: PQQ-binding-like beta-propeller repeat protein [Planctomycetales bacterium]|nr:PQQ-binding-like beta-propeller repeat protein [Planctomycetales bacterium]